MRILNDGYLFKLTSRSSKFIQVGSSIVEVYVLSVLELFQRCNFGQLNLAFSCFGRDSFGLFGYIDSELSGFFFHEAVKVTLSAVYGDEHFVFGSNVRFNESGYTLTVFICFGDTVIVIFHGHGVFIGVHFINAQTLVDFTHVIVRVSHRDDGSVLDKYGEFPQRSSEVIDNASAFIFLAGEVIDPFAFGQIDTVADIIAFGICFGILINRCHQEVGSIHILVFGGAAHRIVVREFEEHGSDDRHSVYSFFGKAVSIWHQL